MRPVPAWKVRWGNRRPVHTVLFVQTLLQEEGELENTSAINCHVKDRANPGVLRTCKSHLPKEQNSQYPSSPSAHLPTSDRVTPVLWGNTHEVNVKLELESAAGYATCLIK